MADKKKKPLLERIVVLKVLKVTMPYFAALLLLFAALIYWWGTTLPTLLNDALLWIFIMLPAIVPVALAGALWQKWREYVRAAFIAQQTPVLLEFKIPTEILKTPKAMEQVFMNLQVGPGESTFIARWIKGKVRPWYSLEIASIEGDVRMYVWTWKQFRGLIESIFYAQYPNLEIHEVPDYTTGIHPKQGTIDGFAVEWKPKKSDIYPIKTYLDLELDKAPKDAGQIVDPIAGVFEKLSTFGAGEQFWVQIIIRQNKGPRTRPVFWFEKPKKWTEEVQDEIDNIYDEAKPKKKESVDQEDDGYPQLKPAQITAIKALEKSLDKPAFDVGMRGVYVAKSDSFDGTKIASFLSLWGAFASNNLNSFVPSAWHVDLDYPWEDRGGKVSAKYTKEAVDAFRRRSIFHAPYDGPNHPHFVLTTEELATLFHFPSSEVRAPGLRRLASSKSEPPANLPT